MSKMHAIGVSGLFRKLILQVDRHFSTGYSIEADTAITNGSVEPKVFDQAKWQRWVAAKNEMNIQAMYMREMHLMRSHLPMASQKPADGAVLASPANHRSSAF